MAEDLRVLLERQRDDFRSILQEAAAARSALCEHELIIRIDNIIALARTAIERDGNGPGLTPEIPPG